MLGFQPVSIQMQLNKVYLTSTIHARTLRTNPKIRTIRHYMMAAGLALCSLRRYTFV